MKTLFSSLLSVGIALGLPPLAKGEDANEAAQAVLDARAEPFVEFARIFSEANLSELPTPGESTSDSAMSDVESLLWDRISSVNLSAAGREEEALKNLAALCEIRERLLKHNAYTNLFFASYIEETVSTAIIAALMDGNVTSEEAGGIRAALAPRIPTVRFLDTIQPHVSQSKSLAEFRTELKKNDSDSLDGLALALARENRESLNGLPENMRSGIHPASFLFNAALASASSYVAVGLIEFAARGGDLNAKGKELRSEIEEIVPEMLNEVDPGSLIKIKAGMYEAFLENVVEWKQKSGSH